MDPNTRPGLIQPFWGDALPDPTTIDPSNGQYRYLYYSWIVASTGSEPGPLYQCVMPSGAFTNTNAQPTLSTRLFVVGDPAGGHDYSLIAQIGGCPVSHPDAFSNPRTTWQEIGLKTADGSITFGAWHHVLLSVDIGSGGLMIDVAPSDINATAKNNTFQLVLDGTAYGGTTVVGHEQAGGAYPTLDKPPVPATLGIGVGQVIALPYNPQAFDQSDTSSDN
jgi:hypothetical protein